jgi:hypothetical protein
MSFPETVIVVVTCHGNIIVNKETDQPRTFHLPDKMKLIKMSAVTPGVCNLTIDDDVDKFIETILNKKNKKDMKKGLKHPEKYAQTLSDLYKSIEEETVNDIFTATPDSDTQLRNDYIHHRDKSYKIITYDRNHPDVINKEYSRNNKTEQNSSAWDYGIYCLNMEGKPDLISKLKGRSFMDKNVSIFLEEIVDYFHENGVKKIILFDLSCSNFEYDGDNKPIISDRNSRRIRLNMIKNTLNGGKKRRIKNKTQRRNRRRRSRSRSRSRV